MHTTNKISLLILLAALCSCKQTGSAEATAAPAGAAPEVATQDASPATEKTGFPSLEFKMDGALVQGTTPGVMIDYIPAKKEVNIRANTPAGIFAILIDNVEGTGTYTIGKTSKNGAGIMGSSKAFEVKKSGTPFTVTIDSVDELSAISTPDAKAISGSFQGKLMDDAGNTVEITDGKFSAQ
jgi:hypothetical protein